ncbi:G-type lectin S-receptor-like serine/threonine-protein kinase CES101 [Neltuma alba]|uniref:G-type lectin S-receptor-like serine/threonine-protein kinase CES101 n=1 Tax=Neltuma alba TaxID=207710 RepID=UPI0010A58696|nr:G-type lectin S-receptor-like serine/threonine-protein kinase CES101 [Prosopis alba]
MSTDSIKVYERENVNGQCCEIICRNNCSCEAYAPVNRINKTGCQIWLKGTRFTEDAGSKGQSIYIVRLRQEVNRWWIWLIIAVGGSLVLPLMCYLCYASLRKYRVEVDRKTRQKKILHEIGGSALISMVYGKAKRNKKNGKERNEVEIFSSECIVVATNNFSDSNMLGEGGFGPVYKGTLADGQEVAIKRLSKSSGQGLTEFKNEAKLMAKLQHTNLVRLLGLCIERDERIIVYEYMPNKSLDFYIFDASRRNVLDWGKRFSIIEGIAQGLLYLHKYSRLRVIHRDLKASNILLDEEMNPKISDFGTARIFGLRESEENTNRVVGTRGYMAPEYAINGIVSIKIDVFSFGVLLIEILSGKKNNSGFDLDRPYNLIGYAWKLWNEGRVLELMDSGLDEPSVQNKVQRGIHIGLLCVQDQAKDRPSMLDVISFLSNDSIQLAKPKQPAYFIGDVEEESELHNIRQEHYSTNYVTISDLDGR